MPKFILLLGVNNTGYFMPHRFINSIIHCILQAHSSHKNGRLYMLASLAWRTCAKLKLHTGSFHEFSIQSNNYFTNHLKPRIKSEKLNTLHIFLLNFQEISNDKTKIRENYQCAGNVATLSLRIVFCTVGGLGKSDPFSAPYKPVTLFCPFAKTGYYYSVL